MESRSEERRRDRRTALALAIGIALGSLAWAAHRQGGLGEYANVRQLTVEFARLVEQLEKPSAWGF
ncbi:MAG: hypothetical protein DWQ36_03320 [Acidobacteria bacterium]|nr:MAG: hypothetical protein DWQ30_23030 [Acidobacteriota bacterium]REK10729.1 MAG: hypothetical protein DWQ36_03320 [Acidobacteriota bacterium]